MFSHPDSTAYGWLMLTGIVVSIALWSRLAKRDERLVLVYIAALAGAFLGAKLVYLAAEGWMHWNDPDRWLQFAIGKSILGALLGGYAGVEIAKYCVNYRAPTGDWFAVIAPIGILFGRIGCLLHGCCLGRVCEPSWYSMRDVAGVPRWPAVPVEMTFNAAALVIFLVLQRARVLPGQHFHLYLMGYGIFRFIHEFFRATPTIAGPFSGYAVAALAVFTLGLVGFVRRRRHRVAPPAGTNSVQPTNP